MTTEKILDELTEAAGRIGLEVRTEKGNFDGGRCTVGGEEVVMLNKRHLPERRLAVLARCLRTEEMDAIYLPPAVRKALHEVWTGQDAAGQDAVTNDASADASEEAPAHVE